MKHIVFMMFMALFIISCGSESLTENADDLDRSIAQPEDQYDVIKYRAFVNGECLRIVRGAYKDENADTIYFEFWDLVTNRGSGEWEYEIEILKTDNQAFYLTLEEPISLCDRITIEIYLNDELVASDTTIEFFDSARLEYTADELRAIINDEI